MFYSRIALVLITTCEPTDAAVGFDGCVMVWERSRKSWQFDGIWSMEMTVAGKTTDVALVGGICASF